MRLILYAFVEPGAHRVWRTRACNSVNGKFEHGITIYLKSKQHTTHISLFYIIENSLLYNEQSISKSLLTFPYANLSRLLGLLGLSAVITRGKNLKLTNWTRMAVIIRPKCGSMPLPHPHIKNFDAFTVHYYFLWK